MKKCILSREHLKDKPLVISTRRKELNQRKGQTYGRYSKNTEHLLFLIHLLLSTEGLRRCHLLVLVGIIVSQLEITSPSNQSWATRQPTLARRTKVARKGARISKE